ncbi:MAG TPA: GntR family transcriptional regulator, partial [Lapillicoccus sp.]
MTVDWSRDGPELLLGLERSSGLPLARQLQERLRDAIRSGRLERGERLPASRALAAQLGV